MKHMLSTKRILMLGLAAFMLIASGCIKEELDACYTLTVKVLNPSDEDITPLGMVDEASLYIFDEELNYLETRALDKAFIAGRQTITLKYPDNKKLHIIAWGNAAGSNQTISEAKKIADLRLSLKSTNGMVSQLPDSLYYGNKEVIVRGDGVAGGNQEIPIKLKIGSVTMKTIGLSNVSDALKSAVEPTYSLTRTKSAYTYTGEQTGDEVSYNNSGKWRTTEWFTVGYQDRGDETGGLQNVCAGENLSVQLEVAGKQYVETKALDLATGEMVPIRIPEGGRSDIIFEFGEDGNLSVKIRISPWGVVDEDIIL